ncbi:MAG: polyprenyl synthetase family protein [Kiritimatiellia bacterium]
MTDPKTWFTPDALQPYWHDTTPPAQIALAYLAQDGKRFRPRLLATLYTTLGGTSQTIPRQLAIAIECFHKASLIHDDIEDSDPTRDGYPALHTQYGIPTAINTGDYLVAQGYQLILQTPLDQPTLLQIVTHATRAYHALAQGQGEELALSNAPQPPTQTTILRLHERKTAAAFRAAVLIGATAAGAPAPLCNALGTFATAAGIAYQIADDFNDSAAPPDTNRPQRPTLYSLPPPCPDADLLEAHLQAARAAIQPLESSLRQTLEAILDRMVPPSTLLRMRQ